VSVIKNGTAESTLTVYVPGLFAGLRWPASWPRGLARLLARADQISLQDEGFTERTLALFGLPKETGLAALARLGDGGSSDDRWWVRCDPVHLAVDGDRLLLLDNDSLALDALEAERLSVLVGSLFVDDGGVMEPRAPTRWYLTLPHPEPLLTTPMAEVAGRNVDPYLPTGNTRYWRTRLNEVQMLMHQALPGSHGGEALRQHANSVWLWGSGYAGRPASPVFAQVYTDDALVRGAAQLTQTQVQPLPVDPSPLTGAALVVLRGAQGPLQYGDTEAWLAFLSEWTDRWLWPLIQDMKRGAFAEIRILGDRGPLYRLRRLDMWRIWRGWRL